MQHRRGLPGRAGFSDGCEKRQIRLSPLYLPFPFSKSEENKDTPGCTAQQPAEQKAEEPNVPLAIVRGDASALAAAVPTPRPRSPRDN